MIEAERFSDIRPYNDSEIPAAVTRISCNPFIEQIVSFLGIGSAEDFRKLLLSCKTVDDFQERIMAFVVSDILKKTADKLTYSGLHYFDGGRKHVIITNHRDIVLDSAIIQLILHNNHVRTTEIAAGDNLISTQFIEDITRSNKMIKVIRSTSPREVYISSKILSEYIRQEVGGESSSIWIAQRGGRTKDGKDETEQGLLKMLDMSGSGDFIKDMTELELLPVAISYEYEPCDIFKTHELFISRRQKYQKAPDEDTNSILTGIRQWKGNINFSFTEPVLPSEVEYCSKFEKNERFQELAKIIDRQIHSTYKLWPNNYIAADLMNSRKGSWTDKYAANYTQEQKAHFVEYKEKQLAKIEADASDAVERKELEDIFLGIYANPVFEAAKLQQK